MVIPLIMKTKTIVNKKKCYNLLSFVTFKELKHFFKIAAQAPDAGDFLNIFLKF